MKFACKLMFLLALAVSVPFASAQTNTNQTSISGQILTVGFTAYAGQTACKSAAFPSSYQPCNNTVPSPLFAVGIFSVGGTHVRGGVNNSVTILLNGLATVPDLAGYGCQPGDLEGDADGSGDLEDLGPASNMLNWGLLPASYVGVCEGDNTSGDIEVLVQPGYAPFSLN